MKLQSFLVLGVLLVSALASPPEARAQGLTNYAEDYILTELFRPDETAPTRPTGVYVALCTTATTPTEAGTGCTEPTFTGYARQQVVFGAPADGMGSTREIANTATISYGDPDEDGSVHYFAIFDAASGGNMLLYGSLGGTVNFQGAVQDPISFPAGSLKVRQD